MALNGAKTLIDKIIEFRTTYFDFRLKQYEDVFPQFNENPRNLEAGLRSELSYFLRQLDLLSKDVEEVEENIPTAEEEAAIQLVKPILSSWEKRMRPKDNVLSDIEEEQIDQGLPFTIELSFK